MIVLSDLPGSRWRILYSYENDEGELRQFAFDHDIQASWIKTRPIALPGIRESLVFIPLTGRMLFRATQWDIDEIPFNGWLKVFSAELRRRASASDKEVR